LRRGAENGSAGLRDCDENESVAAYVQSSKSPETGRWSNGVVTMPPMTMSGAEHERGRRRHVRFVARIPLVAPEQHGDAAGDRAKSAL
jgi:hypothetical protein